MKRWGRLFVLFFFLMSDSALYAGYCDCSGVAGRPSTTVPGAVMFDEDENITEDQEAELRRNAIPDNGFSSSEPLGADYSNERFMSDVLVVDLERADGYADRDGLWNDSDPISAIWYKLPSSAWFYYGQTDVTDGCNGQECDTVFNYIARIPIPRSGLCTVDIEVWDDDGIGSYELLGKKDFLRIPIAGMNLGWRLLDGDPDWTGWVKTSIAYDDNGIDNPAWINHPDQNPTSAATFSWQNPEDRAGINRTQIHFSSDNVFDSQDEFILTAWGETESLTLDQTTSLPSGAYFYALQVFDNAAYPSDFVVSNQLLNWLEPTSPTPSPTPTFTPNASTPTPAPGAYMIGDIRIYADHFDDLGAGRYRAWGNIQINDHVKIEGVEASLFLQTTGQPWIEGQGLVKLSEIDVPVFVGDFVIEPVAGRPQFGIIQPGEFTSLLLQILGFYFHGQPIDLIVNVVDGWIYCETLIEIDLPEIGLHVTHAEFILDWLGNVSGAVTGFSFQIAGITVSFSEGRFTNDGIEIDYFLLTLPADIGGGSAEAWGLKITKDGLWLLSAHIVLPVIRLEGGFEITGFNRTTGPEAWIEHLKMPYTGYKWCVNGRIHIPNLGDAGPCGIETTFSIFDDQLQQACLAFEGCGLQIPIGSTGLYLYKLGGCVTFNNLPYPDPINQCAVGTIYNCTEDAISCCNFNYPDSMTIKLLAGLQSGPDILGYKAVHADPLWLDINTGWGVGGGGIIKVINNYEIGAGRVCVEPSGVRVNGYLNLAIIRGTLYLLVTPEHAEGAINGSVTIPPGDYWLFELDEPINLGNFLLMLGYYYVPESDFWGSGIWSTCQGDYCSGLKYGVMYSHEIFGQILSLAVDQNRNFYAWIDLNFWGSMTRTSAGEIIVKGDGFVNALPDSGPDYETIPVNVPPNMTRSLFTLNFHGGNPILYLVSPSGDIFTPESTDNQNVFFNEREEWKFYSIRDPQPGTWHYIITSTDGVESYQVQLLRGNQTPEVSIDHVELDHNRARIDWSAKDPDDPAKVSLYYDVDDKNADGAPIIDSLKAGDINQHTNWELNAIPSGTYYIYAKIEDGKNAPVISYYPFPISVQDSVPPLPSAAIYGNAGNHAVHVWWEPASEKDAAFYEVRIGEIGGAFNQSIQTVETEITIDNLENEKPYRFVVVIADYSGNWSAQSNEIILLPDAAGDLSAPPPVDGLGIETMDETSLILNWIPSSGDEISEYLVYYGTASYLYLGTESDQGTSPIRVRGDQSRLVMTGLNKGSYYFFNIRACDMLNNTSDMSQEMSIAFVSNTDLDQDGVPDDWESYYFSSLDQSAADDFDGDDLSNGEEFAIMTYPNLIDSDSDRITDSLDPHPSKAIDADSDGMSDDWEGYHGVSDAEADHDSDGLKNIQEYRFKTDPFNGDSDADSIGDEAEAKAGSDPADPDDPHRRCSKTGVTLEMPSRIFHPGDPCYLEAKICNNYPVGMPSAKLFAVLEAYGAYFFAPEWTQQIDYVMQGVSPGPVTVILLPHFAWPSGVGSADNINFYGLLTDEKVVKVIGEYSVWNFGWRE